MQMWSVFSPRGFHNKSMLEMRAITSKQIQEKSGFGCLVFCFSLSDSVEAKLEFYNFP